VIARTLSIRHNLKGTSMPTPLLDSLKDLVTPQLMSKAASLLGESEANTTKALGAALPSVLGGLLNKASDQGAAKKIFDLLTSRESDGSGLPNIDSFLTATPSKTGLGGLASQFLSSIFGDKLSSVARMISSVSGIKESSASTIVNFAAPLIMSVLGKKIKTEGLNLSGLLGFLGGERDSILGAAPSGLAGALGLGNLANLGSSLLSGVGAGAKVAGQQAGGAKWIWPLLVLVAAVVLLWFLLRDCGGSPTGMMVDSTKAVAAKTLDTAAAKVSSAFAGLGNFLKRTLASGVELNIPEFGFESKLLSFIEDASLAVDKTTWFNFDRLLFETGSATLKPESQEQLRNIAAILKAYPKVKVKIGGYTDNVGDPQANLRLSQSRADNVMKELAVLGVATERITAEGYGELHPVGDNSTEQGRAMNRRIALRVTEK